MLCIFFASSIPRNTSGNNFQWHGTIHSAQPKEREMVAVAEAKRFLDEAEAKNRAAVEKRNSRVAAIAGSLGADVAMRDAEEERKLHEKIQRVLAEQDRRNEEDARNRKEMRDRMVLRRVKSTPAPDTLKSSAIHLPCLPRCTFAKVCLLLTESSIYIYTHTPPICITVRLPFVSRCFFCRII